MPKKNTTESKTRSAIVKLLKKNNTYQPLIDDQLIDSYIFNLWMINESYNDIISRGVVTQIGKDNSFFQKNFSINTYHDCQRLINEITKKLGLEKEKTVVDQKTTAKDNLMKLLI
jgi:hypothetical protein